jgi:tetratricopeptide (TPR) repeat protein
VNTILWSCVATGILQIINANWADAERRLRRGCDLAKQVGSVRRFEENAMALAGTYYYSSQWDAGKAIANDLYEMAQNHDNRQALAWALDNIGRYALREGQLEAARDVFRQGLETYELAQDRNDATWCHGAIAKTFLCEGDLDSARPHVEAVTEALHDAPTTSSGMTEPLSAVAEYYLTIWESSGDFVEARAAVAALGRFASIFVLGRPRYRAFLGWQWRLEGDTRAAIRIGKSAVREAVRLNMPYDEGIACFELARHYPQGGAQRKIYLERAEAIFARLGARYDLERTQQLLGG